MVFGTMYTTRNIYEEFNINYKSCYCQFFPLPFIGHAPSISLRLLRTVVRQLSRNQNKALWKRKAQAASPRVLPSPRVTNGCASNEGTYSMSLSVFRRSLPTWSSLHLCSWFFCCGLDSFWKCYAQPSTISCIPLPSSRCWFQGSPSCWMGIILPFVQ